MALAACLTILSGFVHAERQMENLGRGVVAVHEADGAVFVSWRLLAGDPADVRFNLYRTAAKGEPVKLNSEPLTAGTNFVDRTAGADQPYENQPGAENPRKPGRNRAGDGTNRVSGLKNEKHKGTKGQRNKDDLERIPRRP